MIADFNFIVMSGVEALQLLEFQRWTEWRKVREKILKDLNAESSDPSADLKCEKLKISILVSGEDWASSLS